MQRSIGFILFILFSLFFAVGCDDTARSEQMADDSDSESAASPSESSEPITEQNWLNHPRIRAIRDLYADIESCTQSDRCSRTEKQDEYCGPGTPIKRVIWRDKSDRVVKYSVDSGSDDAAITTNHYYDRDSRLRFVFITGGAYNDARLEQRIYFDESGARIWERHAVSEPGYSFHEIWPEDMLARDAVADFDAEPDCL
ncbi:MAG: hypothetical protein KDK27_15745 [Leptospiraceae bacterium]|nr:hypothetical protein [Leptospiraceae bacterium]